MLRPHATWRHFCRLIKVFHCSLRFAFWAEFRNHAVGIVSLRDVVSVGRPRVTLFIFSFCLMRFWRSLRYGRAEIWHHRFYAIRLKAHKDHNLLLKKADLFCRRIAIFETSFIVSFFYSFMHKDMSFDSIFIYLLLVFNSSIHLFTFWQVIDTGRVVVREKDPARERRRISRQREKRATLILGLIMGAFIACWLPFFFLYLLAPVCPSCNIQPWGFAFAFWLGYINSALNPVRFSFPLPVAGQSNLIFMLMVFCFLFVGHLHHFQQRLQARLPAHSVPMHNLSLLKKEEERERGLGRTCRAVLYEKKTQRNRKPEQLWAWSSEDHTALSFDFHKRKPHLPFLYIHIHKKTYKY